MWHMWFYLGKMWNGMWHMCGTRVPPPVHAARLICTPLAQPGEATFTLQSFLVCLYFLSSSSFSSGLVCNALSLSCDAGPSKRPRSNLPNRDQARKWGLLTWSFSSKHVSLRATSLSPLPLPPLARFAVSFLILRSQDCRR